PYYPYYGNGGYDVSHYDLRLKYQPQTDELEGTATILAKTTQDLSRFDLDFLLDVSEVRVNGAKAAVAASGQHELQITPAPRQPTAGQRRWRDSDWRENTPATTPPAPPAIGRFDTATSTSERGVPCTNAYSKDLGDNDGAARASVERTGEIADWLSGYFGPY